MDSSVFMNKAVVPTDDMLRDELGERYGWWLKIRQDVREKYPEVLEEWNFPGTKFGWSYRMKDKKRAILYLLPRNGFFLVAFVFGQKATNVILEGDFADLVKQELEAARVYAEGRGIRIPMQDETILQDVLKLISVKLAN